MRACPAATDPACSEDGREHVMGEQMDKAKGTIKENVGDATDNEDLEREGKMDRAGAEVKEKANDAVDTVKDAVNDATDRDD
jgi:uncharacterized protein YjbJ (UPF0337 family)